jgi:transcriptional regulator with XRE-family HTH domain
MKQSAISFARKLKDLRKAKGLTQVALAKASGMPVSTIRDYEQGKREPLFSNAHKIARGLGVSMDALADDGPAQAKLTDKKSKRTRRQT